MNFKITSILLGFSVLLGINPTLAQESDSSTTAEKAELQQAYEEATEPRGRSNRFRIAEKFS